MYIHHKESIKNISEKLKKNSEVLGVLIGGSIAHGFESENSDIDIMIIISNEDYKNREKTGDIHYWEKESCTYDEGYIDGKYISLDFMNKVAYNGSEPARFAFDGTFIAFSKIEGLQELINKIAKYPINQKDENIKRFLAQVNAWNWYFYEAKKHENEYLINHSISNLILFGGRLILAYNERLYPYHKWFLRVLQEVKFKPENIIENINNVLNKKDTDSIETFYNCIVNFTEWGFSDLDWASQFMADSELNWLEGKAPISDI